MSLAFNRELMAQTITASAICVGGWMLLVQPKVNEFNQLDAQLQQMKTVPAADHGPGDEVVKQVARIRERAGEINARSATSRDSSALYGLIMNLAREQGVGVESVRPGDAVQQTNGKAAVSMTRLEINLEAPYESVASFLHALEGLDAYLRISTLALSPTDKDGRTFVSGRVVCEAMNFPLPDAVVALQEDAHAKQ